MIMNRVFDPIDIVFIALISCYLIVLITIGLVLWYQKEKKDKMLLEMDKSIKEIGKKEKETNKKETSKKEVKAKETKNKPVKKETNNKKTNAKKKTNNTNVRYKGKGPTKKKTVKRKKSKKTNGKNKKRK